MKTEAQLFKALAEETRLKILFLLMEEKELCVSDIAGVLLIEQSASSRHLQYLYHAGLITKRREGFNVYCRISAAPGSWEEKQLHLLREKLTNLPTGQALRQKLRKWMAKVSPLPNSGKDAKVPL
jgi:ArsR family transcriptional regulator, arsenate/arsenite/antimonite-responsive transcriptional repressor